LNANHECNSYRSSILALNKGFKNLARCDHVAHLQIGTDTANCEEMQKSMRTLAVTLLLSSSAVFAEPQLPSPARLSDTELSSIAGVGSIETLIRSSNLQEAVWTLLDARLIDAAIRLEAHILWILESGKIVSASKVNGGRVFLVTFEGGLKAIMKPEGERSSPRGEVFSYQIDRLLNLQIVPATAARFDVELTHDNRPYRFDFVSLQAFIPDATPVGVDYRSNRYDDERLYTLDFLLQQIDRNAAGVLKTASRSTIAVDNSMIEGFYLADLIAGALKARGEVRSAQIPRPINSDIFNRIKLFLNSRKLEEQIERSGSDSNARNIRTRATQLLQLGPLFPAPAGYEIRSCRDLFKIGRALDRKL